MLCDTLDATCLLEIAKAVPGFFTAGAAVFGASMAKKGLDKWKIETVGKRRAELAEQTLVTVYEARDVLKLARSGGRSHTRVPEEGEDPRHREMLDGLQAPIDRLLAHSELFAKLRTLIYPLMAMFGQKSVVPIRNLINQRDDIVHSARTLASRLSAGTASPELVPMVNVVFGASGDDFDQQLDQAVAAIENICHAALTSE